MPIVDLLTLLPCGEPGTRRLRVACRAGHAGLVEVCPEHEHQVLAAGEVLACLRCERAGAPADMAAWPP
ncbi:MAG TPA: hypothetical protein VMU51_34140 [Mycobacteriales bacterium]|nr:hypothetical protein [Mycobacteriales bacterium]